MVDSDCLVSPTWLSDLTMPIIEEDEAVVMGWEEAAVRNPCADFIQEQNKQFLDQYRDGKYITALDTKNCAFRSDILRENGFDSAIGNLEDFELALRLRGKYRIRFLEGVRVRHDHKTSAWSWMKLQFNRGFWARQIYRKHRDLPAVRNEIMFESLRPLNMISFPFWMAYQFLKNPSQKVWLMFISELGWRIGLLF